MATMTTAETPDAATELVEEQRRASSLLAAPKLEKYAILEYIGEGTYGDVWKARDLASEIFVAIKRFRKQPVGQSRDEVKMLAALDDARGIVEIKFHHLESEPYCYVMEYIDGGTLADLIADQGKLPFNEASRIFRQLIEALENVHYKGAVHCDLKPENILMHARRNPRLTDFGQARGQSTEGSSLGTRFYMPPEQARLDAPDPRWDIYALGAILYEMLTGQKPRFDDVVASRLSTQNKTGTEFLNGLNQYADYLENAPKPSAHRRVPGMHGSFADLIDRCLAVDPAERPENAAAVLKLLEDSEKKRRRWPLLLLGGVTIVFLLAAAVFLLSSGTKALNDYEALWIGQIVDDNRAIASAIAKGTEERINKRTKIVSDVADNAEWHDLLANIKDPGVVTTLEQKVKTTHERYQDDLDRWTITNSNGNVLYVFGEMEPNTEPRDDPETKREPPFRWRSWFNSNKDVKGDQAQKLAYNDLNPGQEVLMRRRKEGKERFLSQPYRRKGKFRSWTLTVSKVLISDDNQPIGVLSGQFDYRTFNKSIRGFEEDEKDKRKILIVNELGQTIYHPKLDTDVESNSAPEVDEVNLNDHFFFKAAFAETGPANGNKSHLRAYRDPWADDRDLRQHFVGHALIKLESGQRLAVFVLHEEEDAIKGFNGIRTLALSIGGGLSGIGILFVLVVGVGIFYFRRREEAPANATVSSV